MSGVAIVTDSACDLTAAEVQLMNKIGREKQLSLALDTLRDDYDYILIDCPPALNMLTVNALVAGSHLVVPIQSSYFALEGTDDLLADLRSAL